MKRTHRRTHGQQQIVIERRREALTRKEREITAVRLFSTGTRSKDQQETRSVDNYLAVW